MVTPADCQFGLNTSSPDRPPVDQALATSVPKGSPRGDVPRPGPPAAPARLCLFVAGGHDHSRRAIANLRHLCSLHLPPDAEVEVLDIQRAPASALRHQVLVAPTLLRLFPLPHRRVVGDLSDVAQVLRALDLPGIQRAEC